MADWLTQVARWLAVLFVAGAVGPPGLAAEPGEKNPPTMTSLPAWVRSQARSGRMLRLALIGCNPDASDPRLRPDERFRIRIRGGKHAPPSSADTAMVVWLRAAAPRLSLDCSPIERGAGNLDAILAESIAWVTGPGPVAEQDDSLQVLYIPSELLGSRPLPQAENLIQSIGECWRIRCLPITIAQSGQAVGPVGSLVVSVVPRAEGPADIVNLGDRDDLKKLAGRPIALRLPSSCLEGAPRELDEIRAAAAYLMIAAAALPADGPLSHLERAARLCQTTPVHWARGSPDEPFRLVDVRAAACPAPDLIMPFIDRAFPWPARVVDLDPNEAISVLVPGAPLEEISRRILTSVRGEARLRHLNAVARLAGLQPIFLTRAPRQLGLAFYRLDPKLDAAARESIVKLLHTLEGRTDESLFKAVGGDEPLAEPRPRH